MGARDQRKLLEALTRVRRAQRDAARWGVARAAGRVDQAQTDVERLAGIMDDRLDAWRQALSGAAFDPHLAGVWAGAAVRAQADLATGEAALESSRGELERARQGLFHAETNLEAVGRIGRRIGRRLARRDEERALGEGADRVTRSWGRP